MKLSTPIYRLKQQARQRARAENIPLHAALDQIAINEGFATWSHLSARVRTGVSARDVYKRLSPGELVLTGARPGLGKTLFSLQLCVEAMKAGHRAHFFSLEYTRTQVADRFTAIGENIADFGSQFIFDGSDEICADYIAAQLDDAMHESFVVVDYLQLLDQRRDRPDLESQIKTLRAFARRQRVTTVFISQIDRRFDSSGRDLPDFSDIRLPNPLDLGLFDKACFLNGRAVEMTALA